MAASAQTGSRIRERRLLLGLKQSAVAKSVDISPAYLNLIEHNKRKIGGKLLMALGRALDSDPGQLAEGAEATLIAALRDAAARLPEVSVEAGRVEELAGQFAGWADLVVAQQRQIAALEQTVETLNDRMAHDPHLAASLHDLLSSVTAIRSTASILVETPDIVGEWRDRFHRNVLEDATRLADGAHALVGYLDAASEAELGTRSPQDEVEAWLEASGYHLPELERALPESAEVVLRQAGLKGAAKTSAARYLARYRADAVQMPLPGFSAAARDCGFDPLVLAGRFNVDLAAVLRRIAALPVQDGAVRMGLVCCDSSGTLTFRKPIEGFSLPRVGAACPLWPLYQALSRPMVPLRAMVEVAGRDADRFLTYAIAQPVGAAGFDAPPVYEAVMLIVPAERESEGLPVQEIGSSCRICPRAECSVRREPSILRIK